MTYTKRKRNVRATPSRTLEGQAATMSLKKARILTEKQPNDPEGWKQLGAQLAQVGKHREGFEALEKARKLNDRDAEIIAVQGRILHQLGDIEEAVLLLKKAIEIQPSYAKALNYLGYIYYSQSRFDLALEYAQKACEFAPNDAEMLNTLGNILAKRFEYSQAREVLDRAVKIAPNQYLSWNNLGNVLSEMGDLDSALDSYRRAHQAQPSAPGPFSNLITTYHYHPYKSAEEISDLCKKWNKLYAKEKMAETLLKERNPNKRLRIGMLSDGFRGHPVGRMITSAMESMPKSQFEFYLYSTNNACDGLTERLKAISTQWKSVQPLKDAEVAKQIREDDLDIFIDLAGHNSGNRAQAVSMRLAPLQVKWVGGLINTTGIEAIDYLVSDHVETPKGVDKEYVEKIIRLPDDYICYVPPKAYEPDVGALPALRNGYITLGCFNSAVKINNLLLKEWANILAELPGSRLLLKSMQYQSKELCNKITAFMESQGISRERVVLEGPSPHAELLDAYNRVDIALDPWPYSGGLTTCEAFLMGVPVVSLPGPTFAGRHSATHLVNAGMPELVVNSWEEYRQRVLELASDLDSLATIRQHLRQILLESPVCDARRFARHFTDAMRAIWQRHCEDKAPAALTFNKEGQAWFEGEEQPVEIVYAPETGKPKTIFNWQLSNKIVVIDNSAKLIRQNGFDNLLSLNAFGVVAFDPSSQVKNPQQFQGSEDVQIFPHALLGDGKPATLYACQDPALSSTLEPLSEKECHSTDCQRVQVIAQLPINTIALDSIEGLESLDWLILDELSDAMAILEHGGKLLADTLLIQVRVAFQPTHRRQPNLAELQHWMARHGFRLYRFNDMQYRSYLSENISSGLRQASDLVAADVIFVRDKLGCLESSKLIKLAFIMHSVFNIRDFAYECIRHADGELAEAYLNEMGLAKLSLKEEKGNNFAGVSDRSDATVSASASVSGSRLQSSRDYKNNKYSWKIKDRIRVVDVGANPIDGTPPYASLLKKGVVDLVGFEPQREALDKLREMAGPRERYLPHAVGNGDIETLYLCQASGMTSTLRPNSEVLDHFQGYPIWGKVIGTEKVKTVRLDDISEIEKVDWLKIDIQGGELNVFKNAEAKLEGALVIQTEVNFIPLYKNQPLFAEIDQWMREHGFMLHTLLEERKRLYAPMVIRGGIHAGINQLTTADAVYVRDINSLDELAPDQIKKMALILHEAYCSYDFSLRILSKFTTGFDEKGYLGSIGGETKVEVSSAGKISRKDEFNHCFVMGCGHTGTTLMASILGGNKDIYTIRRETGWFLDNKDFSREYAQEVGLAKTEGKQIICEKTPRHVHCYNLIKQHFPKARLILMTRAAKDVVASLKNRTGNFHASMERWLQDNQVVYELSKKKDVIVVRYEDLVADVSSEMRRVCSFLDVPYHSEMLNFYESKKKWFGVAPQKTSGEGEQDHLSRRAWQMTQPIHDRRDIWKDMLSLEEAMAVDKRCEALMKKLGY